MKKLLSVIACLIMLVNVSCVVSSAENTSAEDDIKTASEFNGSYYKVYDDVELNWTEALEFCKSLGGHLVTITSENEQNFVEGLLKSHEKNFYWLGGYKKENQWTWVTGEPFIYTKWEVGQHDGGKGDENCLMLYNTANYGNVLYTWNDIRNDGTFPNKDFLGIYNSGVICEWEFSCVSDNGMYKMHNWSDWETSFEATCFSQGEIKRVCTHCGVAESKAVEQLTHEYGEYVVVSGNIVIPPIVKEKTCKLCNDVQTYKDWSNIWITILIGVALIGVIIGVVNYIKALKKH